MKISKVNHTKTGIGKNSKNNEISGMLYQHPGQQKQLDFEQRFKSLNKNAKNLYSVFNQVLIPEKRKGQDVEEYKEEKLSAQEDKKTVDKLNNQLSKILFYRPDGVKKIRPIDQIIGQLDNFDSIDSKTANHCILLYLRKSLRKKENELRVMLENIGKKNVRNADKEMIIKFVDFLKEDFEKNEQAEEIKRSIIHQNMLVQPDKMDDSHALSLSDSKGKECKKAEKKGFEQFFGAYSTIKEEDRTDLLRKLRRLLDYYFYREVNTNADFDVWKQHTSARENKKYYVDIPYWFEQDDKPDKNEMKQTIQQLMNDIRKRNIQDYRATIQAARADNGNLYFSSDGMNEFWIHHFENAVERILKKVNKYKKYRLEIGYLSEKVWKDCLNYISIKYIALGKAVYHFSMEEITSDAEILNMGVTSDCIKEGITSFDYELIKANETLQREVSVAISFAANNLARATADMNTVAAGDEDFLLWNEDKIKKYLLYDNGEQTLKSILQFFGGVSKWDTNLFKGKEVTLLRDLQQMIYSLRNENFHFRTENKGNQKWNTELISEMFQKDLTLCTGIERERFYSNNLPEFYEDADLKAVMDLLYSEYRSRASQVPAFNSVFVRKEFLNILTDMFKVKANYAPKDKERWLSALYYLYKEIYYNGFLCDKRSRRYFKESLNDLEGKNDKENKAINDYRVRCKDLYRLGFSLSEICQNIMTEYNAQNSKGRKVQSSYDAKKNPEIFRHYKMLLMKTLRYAMKRYMVENDTFNFIANPKEQCSKGELSEFLPNWKSKMYQWLAKNMRDDADLQRWYVVGRFLNGRTLSLLVGSMRSYIQFCDDIEKRAEQTGNTLYQDSSTRRDNKNKVNRAIEIMDLCIKLSSTYSNEYNDYFNDDEEYANYLANYLDFMGSLSDEASSFAKLDAFCNGDTKLDIYMDGKNPIINRNIIMSKLFAPTNILQGIIEKSRNKVTREEILKYYKSRDNISQYRSKGTCKDSDEQRELLEFQRIKNHIEFRDLVEYSELINELQGQLINWSYMRERDLLYFQLGFHYSCLQNNCPDMEGYKQITGKNKVINNAILYQIMALYINGISIYSSKKGEYYDRKSEMMLVGGRIGAFLSYSKQLIQDSSDYKTMSSDFIYNAGLEVFENINEHDNIIDLRNRIDHFKYYSGTAGSILDMYSEVFDRFFTYDMKYQKSVINQLENILMRHFVIIKVRMGTGEKMIDNKTKKECAKIDVRRKGISSDQFTVKLQEEEFKIDARNTKYLNTIIELLYYPHSHDDNLCAQENHPVTTRLQDDSAQNGQYVHKNSKSRQKKKSERSNNNSVGSGMMADLLKGIRL